MGSFQDRLYTTVLANLALLACLVMLSGCGKGSDRIPLTGKVTVDGKPLYGSISFRPQQGNANPVVMTQVDNGRYRFSKENGPRVGIYEVVIETTATAQKGASAIPVEPFEWKFEESLKEETVDFNFQVSKEGQRQ